MMRYLSICSGIESATVAWHPLGWQPVAFAEIEPFPCAVLHHHYGSGRPLRMPDPDEPGLGLKERRLRRAAIKGVSYLPETPAVGSSSPTRHGVPNLGDFTQIQRADLNSDIDLLVGGTPCQDFSVAGLRAGLDGSRGNITLEFLRLAQRLRPRWLVWENVPGVLSNNGGRDFGAILGGMVELGYGVAYRVLDAQYIRVDGYARAVPQRRRRVFVVGYLGDWRRAAAVLFERACLSGNSPPRREAGQGVAATLSARTQGGGGLGTDFDLDGGLVADTLRQHPRPGSNSVGAVVAFGGNNTDGPIDVVTACNAHAGPHGRLDFESETFIAFDCKASGRNGFGEGPIAPTLRAMGHKGSHQNAGGQIAVAHTLRADGFDASENSSGRGVPLVPVGVALRGRDEGATAELTGDVMTALRCGGGVGNRSAPEHWRVRRLMPVECERLQGFPDGYTDVPYRRRNATPDGPRYKALGNSKAVNCVRWLGMRIAEVDAIGARGAA